MHTNTFCKYRKKLLASPRVHLVNFVFSILKSIGLLDNELPQKNCFHRRQTDDQTSRTTTIGSFSKKK